jgi:hypothetical protein
MQPYFLPYLGYFDLIDYADEWVVFDLAQYVKHRWMNRNRILHPRQGWQYITVPVKKAPLATSVGEIEIQNASDWRTRILNQLDHYRKRAPHFREVRALLESALAPPFERLAELNIHTLGVFCRFLDVDFNYELFSKLEMNTTEFESPRDRVLELCRLKDAHEYANLPGGTSLYQRDDFQKEGLKITFKKLPAMQYECPGYVFEPDLSILDVLMWNRPQDVRQYLDDHKSGDPEDTRGSK